MAGFFDVGHSGFMVIPDDARAAKAELRKQIRAVRRARSSEEITAAGPAIAKIVADLLAGVSVVAAFASQPTEPPLASTLEMIHRVGCTILLPQVGEGMSRTWAAYEFGDPLSVAAPGKPPAPLGPTLPPEILASADLILIPALAIDRFGNRLGQGGGWYDRALAHRRRGVPVYATVFDEEFLPGPLPVDGHDQPVDGVITPERFTPLPANFPINCPGAGA